MRLRINEQNNEYIEDIAKTNGVKPTVWLNALISDHRHVTYEANPLDRGWIAFHPTKDPKTGHKAVRVEYRKFDLTFFIPAKRLEKLNEDIRGMLAVHKPTVFCGLIEGDHFHINRRGTVYIFEHYENATGKTSKDSYTPDILCELAYVFQYLLDNFSDDLEISRKE